jgi:hypothetical protein
LVFHQTECGSSEFYFLRKQLQISPAHQALMVGNQSCKRHVILF